MARKLLRIICVSTLLRCAAYAEEPVCEFYQCNFCDGVACAGQMCIDYSTGDVSVTCYGLLGCVEACD